MKRIRKPVWAIALSLALCLCLLPGTALAGSQDVLEAFFFDNNRPEDYGYGTNDGVLQTDAEGAIRFSVSGFVTVPEAAAIQGVYLVNADNSATRYNLRSSAYWGVDQYEVYENEDPDTGLTDYGLSVWIENLVIPDAVPGDYRLLLVTDGGSYSSGGETGGSDGLVRVQADPNAPFTLRPRVAAGAVGLTAECPADLEYMTLWGAGYSAEGQMLDVVSVKVSSGESGSLNIAFGDGAYVKLFALGPDAVPLCDSVRVARPQTLPEAPVTGTVSAELGYLSLQPGESAVNLISASAYGSEEPLTVVYEIDDPAIVSCALGEWDDWGTEVELNVSALTVGVAEVTVFLYAGESETPLDSCSFSVSVESGYVEPDTVYAELRPRESQTLTVRARAYDGRNVKLRCEASEEGVVSCAWGEGSGSDTPLTLTGVQYGIATLRLLLLDADDESVLGGSSVYVRVLGGSLSLSEEVLTLSPGQQKTVTVTGAAFDSSLTAQIVAEDGESQVIDWTRGALGSGEVSLTVTALAEGTEDIAIILLDAKGRELNSAQIRVYVSN